MQDMFLDHGHCSDVSLSLMLEEIAYELRQRDRVYPRLIEQGRLTQAIAERHYRAMVGVQRFLQTWSQLDLFPSQEVTHALQKIHDQMPKRNTTRAGASLSGSCGGNTI